MWGKSLTFAKSLPQEIINRDLAGNVTNKKSSQKLVLRTNVVCLPAKGLLVSLEKLSFYGLKRRSGEAKGLF